MSRTELLEKIDVLLGGQAAEKLIFGEITTGAQNDLDRATDIARSMVTQYGMTETLGHVTYRSAPNPFLQVPGYPSSSDISEESARLIDEEVRAIMNRRMEEALLTLKHHEKLLHRVAEALLDKETLEREEFLALLEAAEPKVSAVENRPTELQT